MSQPTLDLDLGAELDDGGLPTYSVAELAEAVNGALHRRFSDGVWVRGEIQGWSERGPHAYFRLVEETATGKATVNVQFFATPRARLRPVLAKHRLRLGDGLKVRIFGHVDFFAPSGQLGVKMSGLDPRFTLGEMAMHRDEVVRRLVADGSYDANRSRPMSPVPLRVGVVTSLAGAAWADFVHQIERSGFGFRVRVADVRVQGELAVEMVSSALRALCQRDDVDVVVVIRGGGARSELVTFDHESIARAIASSPVPVITGLGHETDRSVADEVAHTAVTTPTACAAALVDRVRAFRERSELAWAAVQRRATTSALASEGRLDGAARGLRHQLGAAIDRAADRLDQRVDRLRAGAARPLTSAQARCEVAAVALRRTPLRLDSEQRHVDSVAARVRLLDPATTMARGWSITRTVDGVVVRAADSLTVGTELVTTFAAGSARSTVDRIQP